MLQAGFCAGSGMNLTVWSTQAGAEGVRLEIRRADGAAVGSFSIDDPAEGIRLLAAVVEAVGYIGWLNPDTETKLRRIVDQERRRTDEERPDKS